MLRTLRAREDGEADAENRFYTDRNMYIGLPKEEIQKFADSSLDAFALVNSNDLSRYLA